MVGLLFPAVSGFAYHQARKKATDIIDGELRAFIQNDYEEVISEDILDEMPVVDDRILEAEETEV